MRTRRDILRDHVWKGMRGVSSDGAGNYTCHECGEQWRAHKRWRWWPIRLHWVGSSSFGRGGFEVTGPNARIEQLEFAQAISIWRLRIILGDGWWSR